MQYYSRAGLRILRITAGSELLTTYLASGRYVRSSSTHGRMYAMSRVFGMKFAGASSVGMAQLRMHARGSRARRKAVLCVSLPACTRAERDSINLHQCHVVIGSSNWFVASRLCWLVVCYCYCWLRIARYIHCLLPSPRRAAVAVVTRRMSLDAFVHFGSSRSGWRHREIFAHHPALDLKECRGGLFLGFGPIARRYRG